MPEPVLSIVIVNYNSGEYLSGTLRSIMDFPPGVEWDVIVFDNNSTDDSIEKAKRITVDNRNFKFILSEKNLGFAGGNNKVIDQLRSKHILLLNPDTSVTKNSLDVLINYLDQNDDVGAVGPCLIDKDNEYTVSFGWFPTARGIISGAFLPKRLQSPQSGGLGIAPDESIKEPMDVDYVSGACLMTSREIFYKTGLLDENYFAYFEETDWCLRLKKRGYRVVLIPSARVYHYEGKSFAEIPYKKMEIFVTSAKRFFSLHFPSYLKILYIIANVTASFLKIVYLSLSGWVTESRRKRVAPALAHHRAFLRALLK